MSDHGQDKLDSESIRQGLLSIRNSQIELLNELKNQTQQIKKTPLRLSTEDSKNTDPQSKIQMFTFPPQNADSEVRYNPPSPSPIQKPFSFGYTPDRQIQSQLTSLKGENKMLNETLQKLLYSRSLDKERVRQLQSYLYFSSKIHLQLYNQILNGTPLAQVRKNLENDIRLNEDIYAKYQESNHELILQLLQEKEADYQQIQATNTPNRAKEKEIALQLEDLKEQIVTLMKNNHQKNDVRINSEQQSNRIKEHNQILTRKCGELQGRIEKLENDNKQLALCWQRQINERKKVGAELDRLRRDSGMNSERERQINFIQKDLEMKLNHTHGLLKEKEREEAGNKQTIKRLTDTVELLKEENEKLKRDIKSIEELRETLQRDEMTNSKIRENELVSKLNQQTNVLRNYEKEIFDLRNHLGETQRNLEMMSQMHARQREAEVNNQEMYWKKMHAIRTSSTVEHLWQVKRVQYDNINELLVEIKDKGNRI